MMVHHSSHTPPSPNAFDAILSFFQALSSFAIFVGVASLAFSAWAHRRNRRATDIQGLTFDTGNTHIVTIANGEGAATDFAPRAMATGPGVRYGARTLFWVDDKLMKFPMWDSDVRGRFDVDSRPMEGRVTIPVDLAPQVWFGVSWDAVAGRGIRTEFVRVNLDSNEIQVWKWLRFVRLHHWWCGQRRLQWVGGGKHKPAGRWKVTSGDTTAEWQFPT